MADLPKTKSKLPGFHADIDEDAYHRHPTSLSVSGAKTILKAPALYQWQRENPVVKKTFEFGSAAHAHVLGAGMDQIVVAPFDNWRTTAAKAIQAEARAAGKSPILAHEWQIVEDMAEKILEHRLASHLLREGQAEVSAFAVDQRTGVMRRGRFDWLGKTILTDYKSTVCADPEVWKKDAAKYGYHMQAGWYLDLARDLGHPAEAFAFVCQEKTPPYLVSVIELDARAVERGRELNNRALERFRDCTASGLWPAYVPDDQFAGITLPAWIYYDQEEA